MLKSQYVLPCSRQNGAATCPENLQEEVRKLDIGEPQRQRLQAFLMQKQKVAELLEEDFEKLGELGAGSGGVVTRVLHRPTDLIMARKVDQIFAALCRYLYFLYNIGFQFFVIHGMFLKFVF